MNPMRPVRLGTRGSSLARWQAEWVARQLEARGIPVELVLIATQGDVRSGPIGAIGTRGVFTKEIQVALLDHRIDIAVHSLKDLPTDTVDQLALAAVPLRERPGDALVGGDGMPLASLPAGSRVGTGSVRRRAQLRHVRPDLELCEIRGNVDTRLRHLDEGRYDALVLAEAGLVRLGLAGRITEVLSKEWMLPAAGQGALGLETRADDSTVREYLGQLDDPPTHAAVLAERSLLAALGGGCLAPIGAWGRCVDDVLQLDAAVLDAAGTRRIATHVTGRSDAADAVGREAAQRLLDQGAAELIASCREAG